MNLEVDHSVSTWRSCGPLHAGIVGTINEIGNRRLFMGGCEGINEQADERQLAAWGSEIHVETLERLLSWLRKEPTGQIWMSFVNPDKLEGDHFLGVIICRARSGAEAIARTHQMGINPGGEVAMTEVPLDNLCPDSVLDRLLSREEAEKL